MKRVQFCGVIQGSVVIHPGETAAQAIEPPPRYRDIKIAGSYDDNVIARTPRAPDPERLSAAEAKRARKAAKFKRENST